MMDHDLYAERWCVQHISRSELKIKLLTFILQLLFPQHSEKQRTDCRMRKGALPQALRKSYSGEEILHTVRGW